MRRRVRLIISINFIRQVYAFGDAHSTGTSTLKKHRCMALVTTSSPLTPTSVLPSHSPSLSQSEHNAYVNFPSPSVIVSIATMRSSDSGSDAVNTIATRYMSPADRDELIRNAGVVLGSGGCVTGAAFVQLAKNLVELGAKHGTAVVEDLGVLFKSPGFEMILPGVAYEYQNHFVEEARACAGGIGVVVTVTPEPSASKLDQVVNVTLKMSYVTSSSNPLLQQTPLRHVQLSRTKDLSSNVAELVKRTLKEERLDHLRRAVVCNSTQVLSEAFCGDMASLCSLTVVENVVRTAFSGLQHVEWKNLFDAVQDVANVTQLMGWEMQLNKAVRPTNIGFEWIELVVNMSAQMGDLQKLWQDHRQDAAVWNRLDRHLLHYVSVFFNGLLVVLSKLSDVKNGPTLCNVLLARVHLVALCTPKSADPSALLALKHATLTAVYQHWQLELIHRMACVLHPAFKHMRRLDVSDRERSETYAMVRNLLRHVDLMAPDHILRNTLEGVAKNGDVKRKSGRADANTTPKRPRTSSAASVAAAAAAAAPSLPVTPIPLPSMIDIAFDFSDLADFNLSATDSCGFVPERDELDLYLEEKIIQQDMMEISNVLIYWKNRKNVFPGLSQLAFWILSLPPATYSYDSSLSKSDSVIQRLLFQIVNQNNSCTLSGMELGN